MPVVAAGAAVVVAAAPVLVPFVVLPVTLVVLPVMLLLLWLWPMALERKASANNAKDRRRFMPKLAAPELTAFPSGGAAVVVAIPVAAASCSCWPAQFKKKTLKMHVFLLPF